MKFAQFAIGTILFIEAFLLMYSAQEKYNVHAFVQLIKNQFQDCECMQKITFNCVQSMRLVLVAFLITGAFSLTLGSNILVGLLAQILWTVTQVETYYISGLKLQLNILTQVVFIVVLLSEVKNRWRECGIKCRQQRQKCLRAQQKIDTVAPQKGSALKRQEKSVLQGLKEENKQVQSQQSNDKSKSKKKKNK